MKLYWHPDGKECPHKRCKRRVKVRCICDSCKVNWFESAPATMWEEARRGGFVLRATGAVWCPSCYRRREGVCHVPLQAVVQMELWPELQ